MACQPDSPATEQVTQDLPRHVDLIAGGKTTDAWQLVLRDASGEETVNDFHGTSPSGNLAVTPADTQLLADTFTAHWTGPASLVVKGAAEDFQPLADAGRVLEVIYKVMEADVSQASLAMGHPQAAMDITEQLNARTTQGWQTSRIRLSCFADLGAQMSSMPEPVIISVVGTLKLEVTSARLVTFAGTATCDEENGT
jgi:beta-glucosidase